jgi:hypothetical protein
MTALRRILSATTGSLALLLTACSVPNPNHCSNQDGAATCRVRGIGDYCSLCVAANDGCVDQAPGDDCLHTASAPQTTAAPTTTDSSSSTSSSTGSTSSSTGSTTTGDTTTGDTTAGSTDTSDTSDTGATTTATTSPAPTCGDNKREAGEVCDGTDLNDKDCTDASPMWGGGTLKCAEDCGSYDQSMCCLNVGEPCLPAPTEPNATCCSGTCQLMCK